MTPKSVGENVPLRIGVCFVLLTIAPAAAVMLDADFRSPQTWLVLSPFLIAPLAYYFLLGRNPQALTGIGGTTYVRTQDKPSAAGRECARCRAMITTDFDGAYCQSCGSPLHHRCARVEEVDSEGRCQGCGLPRTGDKLPLTGRLRELNKPSSPLSRLVAPASFMFLAGVALVLSLTRRPPDQWIAAATALMLTVAAVFAWRGGTTTRSSSKRDSVQ
jgi:hypothetical protein